MAIQKNITDEFGVTHSAAYTRVISVFIHPDSPNSASMEVDAFVEIFHDAASRSKSDVSLIKTPFRMKKSSSNLMFCASTLLK